MESESSLGKKAAKGLGKFFVGLLMFVILIAITLVVMGIAVFEFIYIDLDYTVALAIGIGLSLIYAIVVFAVPYLRKMALVKFWAILAILDAAYWAYLIFTY